MTNILSFLVFSPFIYKVSIALPSKTKHFISCQRKRTRTAVPTFQNPNISEHNLVCFVRNLRVMTSISGRSRGTFNHTYYDILEICPVATNQQVKDAYKRLAILKHPDKNLGDPAGACAAFQQVISTSSDGWYLGKNSKANPLGLAQLQTAYDTLSEPRLRAKYDISVIPNTTKAATPCTRHPSPQAPRWRPATPPQRPSPPARPTEPKFRCPKTPFPARDADQPSWLSQGWYEMSINHSVRKEKIYRDEIKSLADQGNWRTWIERYDMLQIELTYQATLRRELRAIIAKLFDFHEWIRPLSSSLGKRCIFIWGEMIFHESFTLGEEYKRENSGIIFFPRSW